MSIFMKKGLKSTLSTVCLLTMTGVGAMSAQVHEPVSLGGAGATSITSATPIPDPLLNAMQQELTRERADLVLPGLERPYFIEYRLEDIATYDAVANYGALTREAQSHQRVVRVEVRVGDYTTDSSSARGDGTLELAPDDNDPAALKFALWTATDAAYKNALSAYAAKLADLKHFQSAPTANDFTPAKPVTLIEPLAAIDLDRAEWKRCIVAASGLFATDPQTRAFATAVQSSSASVSAIAINRYTVDTDGTVLRHGYAAYADSIGVAGQAPDGMELSRNNGSTATTASGLESWDHLRQRTIDDLLSFNALRHAPIVDAEDYHGPVLFSGDAAADVVNHLFVPNIEADRPGMGTTARTQGAYQSSFRTPILPAFLSVLDDPALTTFDGHDLLGAYKIDDEGEPVSPVTVVDHGKLINYLIGREPVKDFPESNGHGRAALGQSAHSRAGVILVKSSQPLSAAAMQAKLVALAKQQGRDVYEVETLGGGNELTPRVLYRVSPNGQRTLVRGAAFDELDQRAIRSGILAAGGKDYVAQTILPVPQTTIAPELLFADIAVKRATEEQHKLPYYPPPGVAGQALAAVKR